MSGMFAEGVEYSADTAKEFFPSGIAVHHHMRTGGKEPFSFCLSEIVVDQGNSSHATDTLYKTNKA